MDKSPDAFRTISEVADFLETPAHVLRFWESRFPQIKPVKRAGGRRYYRPSDVALLAGIRRLLHDEGMTIRGVQKVLREQGVRHVSGLSEEEADQQVWGDEEEEMESSSSDPIPLFGKDSQGEAALPRTEPSSSQSSEITDPAQSKPEVTPASDATENVQADGPFDTVTSTAATDPADISTLTPEDAIVSAPADGPFDEASETAVSDEGLQAVAMPIAAPSDPFETSVETTAEPVEMGAPDDLPQVATDAHPSEAKVAQAPKVSVDTSPRWVAAELRDLRRGALYARRGDITTVVSKLSALRERMAELARTPRR